MIYFQFCQSIYPHSMSGYLKHIAFNSITVIVGVHVMGSVSSQPIKHINHHSPMHSILCEPHHAKIVTLQVQKSFQIRT